MMIFQRCSSVRFSFHSGIAESQGVASVAPEGVALDDGLDGAIVGEVDRPQFKAVRHRPVAGDAVAVAGAAIHGIERTALEQVLLDQRRLGNLRANIAGFQIGQEFLHRRGGDGDKRVLVELVDPDIDIALHLLDELHLARFRLFQESLDLVVGRVGEGVFHFLELFGEVRGRVLDAQRRGQLHFRLLHVIDLPADQKRYGDQHRQPRRPAEIATHEAPDRPHEFVDVAVGEGDQHEHRDQGQHHIEEHQRAGHRQREGQRRDLARGGGDHPFDQPIDGRDGDQHRQCAGYIELAHDQLSPSTCFWSIR